MQQDNAPELDALTRTLFERLDSGSGEASAQTKNTLRALYDAAAAADLTQPIVDFFSALKAAREQENASPASAGFGREDLAALAARHAAIDEHRVTVGGRVGRALEIRDAANARVDAYLAAKDVEAPSGIELWDRILENQARIKKALGMDEAAWNSFNGQLQYAINDVETLARCIDLPADAIRDVTRVTKSYRMRATPYYASLIMPGAANDPVLLQAVPTAEMVDTVGEEIPPVASDHSPARLVDQFYPRVVAVKVTNICAMYCTHCLRIAHIGSEDRTFPRAAYQEALDYIAKNERIRDVLITGGDAFMLSNTNLRWFLEKLDAIEHVRLKRLGTRVPVTTPQRVDAELLDILEGSNDRKPLRVVTQINTAQEITPVSREAFKRISGRVFAVLNQAVLLRGINDSKAKMWKLCETIQESYVRPYYIFNCSYRNPQYFHMRVPVEQGRDIVEGMYGNISGDAVPRYIAAAGGKIPLHRDNLVERGDGVVVLRKPWSGETTRYPDADPAAYADDTDFAFNKYGDGK
ncbi:MAG: KamA family radical SAM protein [Desulfovibrionaceae bacterium]|jgi:lysine 2,3-aminomutase|nr:KamA family radical SAM protein [Desulfovibrionaceae bacterium]